MIIRIQDVINKGIHQHIDQQLDVQALFAGNRSVLKVGPLLVQLDVKAQERIVRVHGQLSLSLEMACSRCLCSVSEQLSFPYEDAFRLQKEGASRQTADNTADHDEEDDVLVVTEDRLDLTPYVEEAALLHLPFVPLCKADCKGLCPSCGADRNVDACSCIVERIDPRLSVLKDLL